MRSRINAVVILAVALVAFTAVSSAKGVQSSRHQLPTAGLTDGGGPMCIPDTGCGYKYAVFVSREHLPAVLLSDGPGPMCFPSTGCGYKDGGSGSGTDFPAKILLADGPGPMCFPSTGCGYRNDEANMLSPN
jgi:hypothetical protein